MKEFFLNIWSMPGSEFQNLLGAVVVAVLGGIGLALVIMVAVRTVVVRRFERGRRRLR